MAEDEKFRPRSIEAMIDQFEGPLIEANPLRIGMAVTVVDVDIQEDDAGDGIEVSVCLKLPNGEIVDVQYPGQPFHCEDSVDLDDMIDRLQKWTGLSRAAVRRRLRRAGFLAPLVAGDLEGND